jgi:hypothetical protein
MIHHDESRYSLTTHSSFLLFIYTNCWLMFNYMTQARDLPKIVVAAYHLIPYFIFDAQEGEVNEYCCCLLSVNLIHTPLSTDGYLVLDLTQAQEVHYLWHLIPKFQNTVRC